MKSSASDTLLAFRRQNWHVSSAFHISGCIRLYTNVESGIHWGDTLFMTYQAPNANKDAFHVVKPDIFLKCTGKVFGCSGKENHRINPASQGYHWGQLP